jgi:hypothetical protein
MLTSSQWAFGCVLTKIWRHNYLFYGIFLYNYLKFSEARFMEQRPKKLLEQVQDTIRLKHYGYS